MWVCSCHRVTDTEIRELLKRPDVVDEHDVGAACGAGTCCGGCLPEIRRLCAQAARTEEVLLPTG